MDIEDRATLWADKYMGTEEFRDSDIRDVLITAYLAGSSQTQQDYSDYYNRNARPLERALARAYARPGARAAAPGCCTFTGRLRSGISVGGRVAR